MVHTCQRCTQIVSDEMNDYDLNDKGEVQCENCAEEMRVQEWWWQQDQDDYANQRIN